MEKYLFFLRCLSLETGYMDSHQQVFGVGGQLTGNLRPPAAVFIDRKAFWVKAYIVDITSIEHVNDNIPGKPGENDLQRHPTKDRTKNCRFNPAIKNIGYSKIGK